MKDKDISSPELLTGSEELRVVLKNLFNSGHSLGSWREWPEGLRICLGMLLASPVPQILLWGPECFCFYNDAAIPLLSSLHPRAMGKKCASLWPENWPSLKRHIDQVLQQGYPVSNIGPPFLQLPGPQTDSTDGGYHYRRLYDENSQTAGILITYLPSSVGVTSVGKPEVENTLREEKTAYETATPEETLNNRDLTPDQKLKLKDLIHTRTEEISGVAGWEYDTLTQEIFLTEKARGIFGLKEGEAFTAEKIGEMFDQDSLDQIDKVVEKTMNLHRPYSLELKLKTGRNKDRLLKFNGFPLLESGKVSKLYGTVEDITQRKMDENKRNDTIRKLQTAQKIGKLGYWSSDLVNDNNEWSKEVCDIFGVDAETFTPNLENWMGCVHPADRVDFQKNFKTIFKNRKYFDFEHRIITPNGSVKWILERLSLQKDSKGNPVRLEGISQDITQQKGHEKEMCDSLREKETLLVELHHRVKNNLAVIAGLMQLQAFEEPNDAVRDRLLECVGRIVSMSSVHEQLYKSNSFSNLDYSKNLKNLVSHILDTVQIGKKISLKLDIKPVTLNVNQAIPTSLIINEVMTNVLKHAFTGRKGGKIHVVMTENDQILQISIDDDGNGLPEDFNEGESKTLGLHLIDILAQQLKGSYTFRSDNDGTSFVIQFKKTVFVG